MATWGFVGLALLLLLGDEVFLWGWGRRVIYPRRAWGSFVLRVSLWLLLVINHLVYGLGWSGLLFDEGIEGLLFLAIVGLLTASMWNRYRVDLRRRQTEQQVQVFQQELQALRLTSHEQVQFEQEMHQLAHPE